MSLEVCRLCLKYGSGFIHLGDAMNNSRTSFLEFKTIFLKLKYCVEIQISLSDQLSKHICLDCVHNLDSFYTFKRMCKNSEEVQKTAILENVFEQDEDKNQVVSTRAESPASSSSSALSIVGTKEPPQRRKSVTRSEANKNLQPIAPAAPKDVQIIISEPAININTTQENIEIKNDSVEDVQNTESVNESAKSSPENRKSSKRLQCTVCFRVFRTVRNLRVHSLTHKPKDQVVKKSISTTENVADSTVSPPETPPTVTETVKEPVKEVTTKADISTLKQIKNTVSKDLPKPSKDLSKPPIVSPKSQNDPPKTSDSEMLDSVLKKGAQKVFKELAIKDLPKTTKDNKVLPKTVKEIPPNPKIIKQAKTTIEQPPKKTSTVSPSVEEPVPKSFKDLVFKPAAKSVNNQLNPVPPPAKNLTNRPGPKCMKNLLNPVSPLAKELVTAAVKELMTSVSNGKPQAKMVSAPVDESVSSVSNPKNRIEIIDISAEEALPRVPSVLEVIGLVPERIEEEPDINLPPPPSITISPRSSNAIEMYGSRSSSPIDVVSIDVDFETDDESADDPPMIITKCEVKLSRLDAKLFQIFHEKRNKYLKRREEMAEEVIYENASSSEDGIHPSKRKCLSNERPPPTLMNEKVGNSSNSGKAGGATVNDDSGPPRLYNSKSFSSNNSRGEKFAAMSINGSDEEDADDPGDDPSYSPHRSNDFTRFI